MRPEEEVEVEEEEVEEMLSRVKPLKLLRNQIMNKTQMEQPTSNNKLQTRHPQDRGKTRRRPYEATVDRPAVCANRNSPKPNSRRRWNGSSSRTRN